MNSCGPQNCRRDDMVLDETLETLKRLYENELDHIKIEKIVIGIFLTGVKLSEGSGGVPIRQQRICTVLHAARLWRRSDLRLCS
jgi:hypothetical protein